METWILMANSIQGFDTRLTNSNEETFLKNFLVIPRCYLLAHFLNHIIVCYPSQMGQHKLKYSHFVPWALIKRFGRRFSQSVIGAESNLSKCQSRQKNRTELERKRPPQSINLSASETEMWEHVSFVDKLDGQLHQQAKKGIRPSVSFS